MFDANFNPTDRQLRQFAITGLIALPVVAWVWGPATAAFGWAMAVVMALLGTGLAVPTLLQPVFVILTIVTLPVGMVIGEVAMLLIYFGLLFPLSTVSRIAGRDSLGLRSQANKTSFWRKRTSPTSTGSYYHQF